MWVYHRYRMSFRDVEDLLAERGIVVSYETVRQWCRTFGPDYARRLKRRQGRLGDTWFLDEVFVTINGQRQYLWRAVDQDGDVIDLLVQPRQDGRAARRFFRRLLKSQRQEPSRLVTDKLGSYRVAHQDMMSSVTHDTARYANNRARSIPSTHATMGTSDARLQITRQRPAIPACSRCHSESVSSGSPPAKISSSSNAASPVVRSVDLGNSSLTLWSPRPSWPVLDKLTTPGGVIRQGSRCLPRTAQRSLPCHPSKFRGMLVQGISPNALIFFVALVLQFVNPALEASPAVSCRSCFIGSADLVDRRGGRHYNEIRATGADRSRAAGPHFRPPTRSGGSLCTACLQSFCF